MNLSVGPAQRAGLRVAVAVLLAVACKGSPQDTMRGLNKRSDTGAPDTSVIAVSRTETMAWTGTPESVTGRHATITADTAATDVIRRYYAAISARDYDAAYALWGQNGKASHQSRTQFATGFERTANVNVTVADSVRIEGAAGSQYAMIPVTVSATLRDGSTQRFTGTYIVRRAMVTGASEADRRWHIDSAELHAVH